MPPTPDTPDSRRLTPDDGPVSKAAAIELLLAEARRIAAMTVISDGVGGYDPGTLIEAAHRKIQDDDRRMAESMRDGTALGEALADLWGGLSR